MPINLKYLQGAKDPNSLALAQSIYAKGTLQMLQGVAMMMVGDDAGSLYIIGKIPSKAVISPLSLVTHGAVTGATAVSIGSAENETALASGLNLATAGTKNAVAGVSVANLAQPLWKLLGFATDPKRDIEIYAKTTTNVTVAAPGVGVHFSFLYTVG